MAGLGIDAYRFSTSWARVLPEGRGTPNEAGLDFYDRLVDGLLERGIKPALTLYHWELPSALADLGGWRNRDVAEWFADFTEVVMGRIGDRVWSAATINEFWCISWLSHFIGAHAPGLRDIRAAARSMHHVLLAHGRSIEVMRGLGATNLGAVCNLEWAAPADDSEVSQLAAARHDAIYNRFFMDGLFHGQYHELALEGLEPHLPKGWQDDFKTITAPVDWCGINYYTRVLLSEDDGPWPSYSSGRGDLPKTSMDWEIYPQGLYDFLIRTRDTYTKDLPLYVTENGMADNDPIQSNGTVPDPVRENFLDQHLKAARRAIEDGVPLRGYFFWSLLDNYEWAYGYKERFGLVHVDFDSLKRTPKTSYHALASALTR